MGSQPRGQRYGEPGHALPVVAKDQAAVDKWQQIKAQAESDPTGLIAQIENGTLGDYQVPVLYSTSTPTRWPLPTGC